MSLKYILGYTVVFLSGWLIAFWSFNAISGIEWISLFNIVGVVFLLGWSFSIVFDIYKTVMGIES